MTVRPVVFWFLAGAALILVAALFVGPAFSHEAPVGWKYPWACCANYDCQAMAASTVSEKPDGYLIESTGEVVGYADKRVKESPDGLIHWCAHPAGLDAGHTICLFVPPKGF